MPSKITTQPGELAYTLTEIRKLHNMTQEGMAHGLNVTRGTYAQWETGRRKMSVSTLERVCEIFDCAARVQPNGVWFFEIDQHDWNDLDLPDNVGSEHLHPKEHGLDWPDYEQE